MQSVKSYRSSYKRSKTDLGSASVFVSAGFLVLFMFVVASFYLATIS